MVYVDNYNAKYRGMIMCHMVADTTAELFEMASRIGVNTKWVQHEGTVKEHFDICLTKKAKALQLGAKEIHFKEYARYVQARRSGKPIAPSVLTTP